MERACINQKPSRRNTNTGKANQNNLSKIILQNVRAFESKEPLMVMKAKDNGNMQKQIISSGMARAKLS